MAQKIKSQKHTYNMTSLIYLYENEQNQIIFKSIFICSKIMKKSKELFKTIQKDMIEVMCDTRYHNLLEISAK